MGSQPSIASASLMQHWSTVSLVVVVVSFSFYNDSDLGLLIGRGVGTVYNRRVLPELCFVLVVAEVDDVGPLLA
jgi:hypothetical protein